MNTIKYIINIFVLVLCIWLGFEVYKMGITNEKITQNLLASQTELETKKLENDQLIYERNSYILNKNELEQELDVSKKEIKSLEQTIQSNIAYIAKLHSETKVDTIVLESVVIKKDSITSINFAYKDDWLDFNGITNVEGRSASTTLNNMIIQAPITIGLTDNLKIFATSENPYVKFTSINGAALENSILTQKKTGWEFGVTFGVGLQYGLIGRALDIGPNVGLGVEYHF